MIMSSGIAISPDFHIGQVWGIGTFACVWVRHNLLEGIRNRLHAFFLQIGAAGARPFQKLYMKRGIFIYAALLPLMCASCGTPKFMASFSPEESGLNLMKITDETSMTIAGNKSISNSSQAFPNEGICATAEFRWGTDRVLDISPNGLELAYLSIINGQWNVMVRKSGTQGSATQRTFRNVGDFSWGHDGNLYFGDVADYKRVQISSTDAHVGSIMRQLTSNNTDSNPVLSNDGNKIYFTRIDKSGAFVWSYDLRNGALTSCCRGYNPSPVGEGCDEFICVRNSSFGTSELWHVNYEKGQETLILTDKNRGFTSPRVSPDGKWILCQGNSKSSISHKDNLDIFVVRIDGTGFIQLTYHPADDCSPVWSPDGKYIYFVSSRANENNAFNIWRMRFEL